MLWLDTILKNSEKNMPTKSIDSMVDDLKYTHKLLFVTGRAGTGKSTLLKQLCSKTKKNYAVLAPTGIAAVNVNGETIHSFFHFKPGISFDEAKRNGERSQNIIYEKLDLLIIDEVSMVRADLLDCIDIFLKKARKKNEPFGGVQIVVFGDLYQLEPIVRAEEKESLYQMYDSAYFFSSWAFQELLNSPEQVIEFVELNKIYRQKDKTFIELLDKIRKKKITAFELERINARYRPTISDSLKNFIYLCTTNASAQKINSKNLQATAGQEFSFLGTIEGDISEHNLPTEWDMKLKVNARVMLLNNDSDKRWINGTLGYITKINQENVYVRIDTGKEYSITPYTWSYFKFFFDKKKQRVEKELIGAFTQYPIKLAWAITIHKSQGQTFTNTVIWLEGRAFANGQVYVALSRCTSLEKVFLNRPITAMDIMVDDKVKRFLIQIKKYIAQWRYPLEEKQHIISKAIKEKQRLTINYVTLDDEQTEFSLEPMQLTKDESGVVVMGIIGSHYKTFRLDQIISIIEYVPPLE